MKEFEEWKATYSVYKGYSDISGAGVLKRTDEQLEDAFKAGMLASADIASRYHDLDWYSAEEIAVAINIEEAIREAAE